MRLFEIVDGHGPAAAQVEVLLVAYLLSGKEPEQYHVSPFATFSAGAVLAFQEACHCRCMSGRLPRRASMARCHCT